MLKLIRITTKPDLVAEIVKQFAFMQLMSEPQDNNYRELQKIDLNYIRKKADKYFTRFCTIDVAIDTEETDLTNRIKEFLQDWAAITDVTAIQQNIHHDLAKLDFEINLDPQ